MSIRSSTEIIRSGAGSTAVVALAGASALHGLWATGSAWPTSSPDELADLVVGRRPMPGPAACATVAAALAIAAAVSASLLVRGVGGIGADLAGVGDAAPAFRRWNRRLYNPLCVTLAILVAVGRRSRS
jgi:hypothetical protein